MKNVVFVICWLLVISCKPNPGKNEMAAISADSLATHIEQYAGKKVCVEGKIVHVCPVNGEKMKLLCTNGVILKIVSATPKHPFSRDLNGKHLKISGILSETRLPQSYVDSVAANDLLLCHIDHRPCIDTGWAANIHRRNLTEQVVTKSVTKLTNEMQRTGKNYISVITIATDKIEELEIVTEEIETTARNFPSKDKHNCNGCPLCGLCFTKNLPNT